MSTLTTNKLLVLPTVSSDLNAWGGELNATITTLDGLTGGILSIPASAGSVTLTSAQIDNFGYVFTGALLGNYTLTFPASLGGANGMFVVDTSFITAGTSEFTVGVTTTSSVAATLNIPFGGRTTIIGQGLNFLYADDAHYKPANFELTLNGFGQVLSSGPKTWGPMPFAATITGWELLADVAGSVTIDLWRSTALGVFPPTSAKSITGTSQPNLTAQQANSSTTLSGWTTTLNQGDILYAVVTVAATAPTVAVLALQLNKI